MELVSEPISELVSELLFLLHLYNMMLAWRVDVRLLAFFSLH
jgi:hypothetical protein